MQVVASHRGENHDSQPRISRENLRCGDVPNGTARRCVRLLRSPAICEALPGEASADIIKEHRDDICISTKE